MICNNGRNKMKKERDYAFGFHDDVKPLFSTGKGLTEEVVREISEIKNEPHWIIVCVL